MQDNTVQTLIDYVKDITGQSNISNDKVVRALNFAVDQYSYITVTSSGKWKFDSPNYNNLPRITATLSGQRVQLPTETIAIQMVETLQDGDYVPLEAIDIRDYKGTSLDTLYGTAGTPKYYDYTSGYLYVYPTPSTATTIRVTTSRLHPRYSTSNLTQATGVVPIHEEYIALYASDRVMIGSNDPIRSQIRQELTVKEDEIRNLFAVRDQDTPQILKPKVNAIFQWGARPNRR